MLPSQTLSLEDSFEDACPTWPTKTSTRKSLKQSSSFSTPKRLTATARETHPCCARRSKHIKWLANKRELNNIVLHSFTHLGGITAPPELAESFITTLQQRLSETGYQVWTTPFGYFCEWDLSVYGESLAKVWKEIH